MKLLLVGDIHFRGSNPRNRVGDYLKDCLSKIDEVQSIAERHDAHIVQTGDIFDSPSISYGVFGKFVESLRLPWFAIAGNHDIFAHNLSTLDRSPIGVLYKTKKVKPVEELGLLGVSFDYTVDLDLHEYKPQFGSGTKVLVVHGMLLEHKPVFDKYTLIDEVCKITTADVIISGHYHLPFEVIKHGKLFINPGALMRMSATEEEIQRIPHVVLLNTELMVYTIIPLTCAKAGSEVLDREAILENREREERMAQFIASLEFTSESRFLNLQEIIERVIANEGYVSDVCTQALDNLARARERRV